MAASPVARGLISIGQDRVGVEVPALVSNGDPEKFYWMYEQHKKFHNINISANDI